MNQSDRHIVNMEHIYKNVTNYLQTSLWEFISCIDSSECKCENMEGMQKRTLIYREVLKNIFAISKLFSRINSLLLSFRGVWWHLEHFFLANQTLSSKKNMKLRSSNLVSFDVEFLYDFRCEKRIENVHSVQEVALVEFVTGSIKHGPKLISLYWAMKCVR